MKVILHACFLLFSGNILKNGGSTDYVMYLLDPFHPINWSDSTSLEVGSLKFIKHSMTPSTLAQHDSK